MYIENNHPFPGVLKIDLVHIACARTQTARKGGYEKSTIRFEDLPFLFDFRLGRTGFFAEMTSLLSSHSASKALWLVSFPGIIHIYL